MKKNIIVIIISIAFFSFLSIDKVSAASGGVYLTGDTSLLPGGQGNITLGVNGSSKVAGVQYKIEASGLEIVSINSLNGTTVSQKGANPSFSVVQATFSLEGISSGTAWANIVVKVPNGAKVGTQGTITVSGVGISLDETEDTIAGADVSKTITVVAPPPVVVPNNNHDNRQNETPAAKVVSSKLKELKINNVEEFVFDPATFEYNINVTKDITSLDIEIVTEDETAKVEITGNEAFKIGENVVTISVKASDNSESIYKITVNVSDSDEDSSDRRKNDNCPPCSHEQKKDNEKLVWIVISCSLVFALIFETAYIIFDKKKRQF